MIDKTGTLTEGRPKLDRVSCRPSDADGRAARLAAASNSAASIRWPRRSSLPHDERKLDSAPVDDFRFRRLAAGCGGRPRAAMARRQSPTVRSEGRQSGPARPGTPNSCEQQGRTVMFVAVDRPPAGLLAVADPIKPSTPAAVASLHALGLRVIMLTGDNEQTARAWPGCSESTSSQPACPQAKHQRMQALRADGRRVAMAGDGINDAPALAAADVGIAMGTGTDVAIESAGMMLVKGDLRGTAKADKTQSARWQYPPEPVLRFYL